MFRESPALGLKPAARNVLAVPARLSRRVGMMAAVLALTSLAAAQNADTRSIDAYLKAITEPPGSSRLAALEQFASSASAGNLRLDALEWIVWEERQTHNDAAADTWSRHLLDADPENALGLALTVDAQRRSSLSTATSYATAQLGLQNLARLRRPEGMSHDEFSQMQQLAEGILNAAAGQAELEQKHYAAARVSLARAVMVMPNDAQLVYALAMADLSGDKPNRPQGYWLLAKAVNLSGEGAAARHIEEFGRKKYKQDGGSDREWDQYLSSTAAPGADAATMLRSTEAESSSHERGPTAHAAKPEAKATASEPATEETRKTSAETRQKSRDHKEIANHAAPASPSKSGWKGEPEPPPESTAAANTLPPISGDAQIRAARAGPPLSLGILLETSLARKGTRDAIVYSLSELMRHFGPEDEAFILSFSNDLVFEEDLTGDTKRLEKALDEVKPHPGTALLDAVGFAAGHLRRISKNDNRVLLVISDGRNANSRIPATASSGEIRASGVRIYCIGMDVGGSEGITRLQALATGTGGIASFITAPDQFRAAAQQVAGRIGIPFEF